MSALETTIGEIVLGDREVFPPYLYAAYRATIARAPEVAIFSTQGASSSSV